MNKLRFSIQVSIIVVATFFLIGLLVSFILFCLCRLELFRSKNNKVNAQIETINKNDEVQEEKEKLHEAKIVI